MTTTRPMIYTQLLAMARRIGAVEKRRSSGVSYAYLSVDDVRAAVRDAAIACDVAYSVENALEYREGAAYAAVRLLFVAADGSTHSITGTAVVPFIGGKPTPQAGGSAVSYALKTALCALFLISDGEPDVDAVPEALRGQGDRIAGVRLEPAIDYVDLARRSDGDLAAFLAMWPGARTADAATKREIAAALAEASASRAE
jgi:hypothetical protein